MHTAGDLMRQKVIAVSPQTLAKEAIDLLVENDVSGLPVVDSSGRVVGVFSEVDQIRRGSMDDGLVQHLMTKQVETVDVEDSLVDVVHAFQVNSVRRLPVTKNGVMVGIIGLRDVVRSIRECKALRSLLFPVTRSYPNRNSLNRSVGAISTNNKLVSDSTSKDEVAEPSTSTQKNFYPPVDEEREATRFQREEGTDFAVIWRAPGEELLVDVHDESLTGLGILVDSDLDLQLNDHIHVVYAGEYMDAEVRHITKLPGAKILIGLSCQRLTP